VPIRPYKEGVAGSNPASPTIKIAGVLEKRERTKRLVSNSGRFAATIDEPSKEGNSA
jgi:hypothetical protein